MFAIKKLGLLSNYPDYTHINKFIKVEIQHANSLNWMTMHQCVDMLIMMSIYSIEIVMMKTQKCIENIEWFNGL